MIAGRLTNGEESEATERKALYLLADPPAKGWPAASQIDSSVPRHTLELPVIEIDGLHPDRIRSGPCSQATQWSSQTPAA